MPTSLVKNRAPAPIQITAEQLLREARDRQMDVEGPKTRRQITDPEELKEYVKPKPTKHRKARQNREAAGFVASSLSLARPARAPGDTRRHPPDRR